MTARSWIGTSGWAYPPWKGRFYPRDLPTSAMLGYYASRFTGVEINSTFYRAPSAGSFAPWIAQVPRAFRFAVKAPATISHHKRLRRVEGDLARFAAALGGLGARRGPALIQLPPNLKKDAALLEDALEAWPRALKLAVEFRDPSWFDDAVYAVLRDRGVALCIADTDDLATPMVATAAWGYLRLRRLDYTPRALDAWAARIRAEAWKDCFVFTRHEDTALGTGFAARLMKRLAPPRAKRRVS
ncbi:MAG TPA: DUF72 domain-containing protein [Planctomycetota bacterium]|nr:DUF72 domain-containing protein [Planctomycetota bacterium]